MVAFDISSPPLTRHKRTFVQCLIHEDSSCASRSRAEKPSIISPREHDLGGRAGGKHVQSAATKKLRLDYQNPHADQPSKSPSMSHSLKFTSHYEKTSPNKPPLQLDKNKPNPNQTNQPTKAHQKQRVFCFFQKHRGHLIPIHGLMKPHPWKRQMSKSFLVSISSNLI